ncbi:MAG: thymidine phosphorylase family protein, partial [Alphaproteobacteria bacterium]
MDDHSQPETASRNIVYARRMGIDTQHELVVFMSRDCHVCRSEGFSAHARVRLRAGPNTIIATLYQVDSELVAPGEVGLSEAAWRHLQVRDGTAVSVSHPHPLESMHQVRAKIFGHRLEDHALEEIIRDIVQGSYSDIHLASFITACSARGLDRREVVALTKAMVSAGDRIDWGAGHIADKHCVGGLPGNRTTPIVVAIITALGHKMPKTSSRAITSPAGTADTMETLTRVDLSLGEMRRVVEQEGGCMVWGGAVQLSPADDTLIRVERVLELDSEGQLVASVLSKKAAAGSSHLVLDLPVGATAKVRGAAAAASLADLLNHVAAELNLKTRILFTDGSEPVGRGVGPALEARDVLAVLQNHPDAPGDLRDRALTLAGTLLDLLENTEPGLGRQKAAETLFSGRAWDKFQAICRAQGGLKEPPLAPHQRPFMAPIGGIVSAIDNRRLAKLAKLAGAPDDPAAGLTLHVHR